MNESRRLAETNFAENGHTGAGRCGSRERMCCNSRKYERVMEDAGIIGVKPEANMDIRLN
jgi:hypothetical protein